MLVCSAPQFPHGVIDPVEEVAKVRASLLEDLTDELQEENLICFPVCVTAGCSLQPPAARGRLSGGVSHRLHGQGWLPARPLRLQGQRGHQYLSRHAQSKDLLVSVTSSCLDSL